MSGPGDGWIKVDPFDPDYVAWVDEQNDEAAADVLEQLAMQMAELGYSETDITAACAIAEVRVLAHLREARDRCFAAMRQRLLN